MRRLARWRWILALSGSLAAGCLFHKPGDLGTTYPTEPESIPVVKDMPPIDPPPPPSPIENYNLRPTIYQSASFEPMVAPAKVEMSSGSARSTEPAQTASTSPSRVAIPEAPLLSAFEGVFKKNPAQARQLLSKPDRSDREQLLSLSQLLLAGFDQKELENLSEEDASKVLEKLRVLTAQLRRQAPLRLDKVCFCKQIDGFGQYQPLAGKVQFSAGCDGRPGDRVQVYAEVCNFVSQAKEDRYETRLSSSLEILDERQRLVATMTPETSADLSQTPREDYFLNFQFHVPANLKPGDYTLRVVVKDLAATPTGQKRESRSHRRTLDFQVCPPGAIRSAKASQ